MRLLLRDFCLLFGKEVKLLFPLFFFFFFFLGGGLIKIYFFNHAVLTNDSEMDNGRYTAMVSDLL